MTKLSDMQFVLLSTAATRDDGSLLPPPVTLGTRLDRIHRSVAALIAKALAAEAKVEDEERCLRRKIPVSSASSSPMPAAPPSVSM